MALVSEAERPRVVILLGPTGVGKSRLAIELAETLGGEIVGADSMQVYRFMDIGTAKPAREDRERVRHHLIDLVTPDQPFHAGLYRTLGRKVIDELHRGGKPIWVVGGTGLYLKSLTQGLFASPKVDPKVREALKREAQGGNPEALYERLASADPETASRLHPHDLFRVIRALEVYESTGMPISFYREQHGFGDRPFRTLKLGLEMTRSGLYDRIGRRVDGMIAGGLLQEVQGLLGMGYGAELKPMRSLGYKHMVQFLNHEVNWDEAIVQMKRDTRHYARRQWTWFRADPEVRWRDVSTDREKIFRDISAFLGRSEEDDHREKPN